MLILTNTNLISRGGGEKQQKKNIGVINVIFYY
jgi:hypothetical protein